MDKDELDSLEMTFTTKIQEFPRTEYALCLDGDKKLVTAENREDFINLRVETRYKKMLEKQISSFSKGFEDILDTRFSCTKLFNSLELEDTDDMFLGADQDTIDVSQWKEHTSYENYEETSTVITWFWEVVNSMNKEERHNLLNFWTVNRYLPISWGHSTESARVAHVFLPACSTGIHQLRNHQGKSYADHYGRCSCRFWFIMNHTMFLFPHIYNEQMRI